MRGFITKDQRYYETENGQVNDDDREVPVRPSEHHTWDDSKGWMGARQSDEFKLDAVKFNLGQVGTLLSVAVMGVSLYFALSGKMEVQNVQIAQIKENQVEMKADASRNILILHGEMEDVKKKLDVHISNGRN